MNPNIKKISSEILSTNFSWLDAGYIKDLDGLMNGMVEGLQEAISKTTEGVHF